MASSSSSSSFIHISLLFTITLLSVSCLCDNQKLSPIVLPIRKDPRTNLYYTSVGIGTPLHKFNLVIDLGGQILWYDSDKHYNSSTYLPLPCESKKCPPDGVCSTCRNGPSKPGCSKISTCATTLSNPFANAGFNGETGQDVLFIPNNTNVPGFYSACVDSDTFSGHPPIPLKGLPKTIKGILGLARTPLALPTQLSSSHHLPHKFALCLPSSTKNALGNLFLGSAPEPDSLIPHQNSSKFLHTTPLILNPYGRAPVFLPGSISYEYFIQVKSIKVDGEDLHFDHTLLSIDSRGDGGTKISTADPFTVLHSSIYKPLVIDFVKKAADRKIKKVAAVARFGACFDLTTIGRTIAGGLDVPTIDLVLQGNVEWRIYGGNSMVLVNKNVACLGFVDGGEVPRTAVVIGGSQLQDNLLVFDLASSKLSFSSSLLLHNATCSHLTA